MLDNMFNNFFPTRQTLIRHLAAWLSIVIYYIIYSTVEGSALVKTVWIFLLIVNYSFTYYAFVLFIWPKILSEKKSIFSILIIVSFIFFCLFFYFQFAVITPALGGTHPLINLPFNQFINNSIKLFTYIIFTSIGTYYNWIELKKTEEDLKVDHNIIEMELLFLKNQFHSHLTFNFLNFCYNKINTFSSCTANSVEEFSDILRYSLNTSQNAPVLLEEEIIYIENYVSFRKFLIPSLNVQIIYKGNLRNTYIFPKVLGAPVEFFLKNKPFTTIQKPCIIFIGSTENEIILKIENIKCEQMISMKKAELLSIEQILQSFYKNEYSQEILVCDDSFSYELKFEKHIK
jgi:hypothetical protein